MEVEDLATSKHYCLKIIQNNKDYMDQSLDEIKLLRYLNSNCNSDESCLLEMYDFFYHREHLMILT